MGKHNGFYKMEKYLNYASYCVSPTRTKQSFFFLSSTTCHVSCGMLNDRVVLEGWTTQILVCMFESPHASECVCVTERLSADKWFKVRCIKCEKRNEFLTVVECSMRPGSFYVHYYPPTLPPPCSVGSI